MEIKSFDFVFTEDEESYFTCLLSNNKTMTVAFWSFYEFIGKTDTTLNIYSLRFDDWEELTNELIDFDYDFKKSLNLYIQQFTQAQIEEFCF